MQKTGELGVTCQTDGKLVRSTLQPLSIEDLTIFDGVFTQLLLSPMAMSMLQRIFGLKRSGFAVDLEEMLALGRKLNRLVRRDGKAIGVSVRTLVWALGVFLKISAMGELELEAWCVENIMLNNVTISKVLGVVCFALAVKMEVGEGINVQLSRELDIPFALPSINQFEDKIVLHMFDIDMFGQFETVMSVLNTTYMVLKHMPDAEVHDQLQVHPPVLRKARNCTVPFWNAVGVPPSVGDLHDLPELLPDADTVTLWTTVEASDEHGGAVAETCGTASPQVLQAGPSQDSAPGSPGSTTESGIDIALLLCTEDMPEALDPVPAAFVVPEAAGEGAAGEHEQETAPAPPSKQPTKRRLEFGDAPARVGGKSQKL